MLAGLGVLPLTACGVVQRVRTIVGGCVDAPHQPDDGVGYFARTLRSRHVRGPVGFVVATAAPVDLPTIENVVYIVPGRGALARDVIAALNYGGAFAIALRANPLYVRHTALVAVDAGESYFHPRASGEDRLAMLTDELPRAVAAFLGTSPEREALIGQSMGGYGALLAALRNPERYKAVAVAGPALFPSYEDERRSVGDAFDSAADFARYDVVAHAKVLIPVRVRIAIGEHDPFLPGVRAFVRACPTADVTVDPGCHDDGFWRASAPSLLSYVFDHL